MSQFIQSSYWLLGIDLNIGSAVNQIFKSYIAIEWCLCPMQKHINFHSVVKISRESSSIMHHLHHTVVIDYNGFNSKV